MLGKLLTPFTTPGAAGTVFRDFVVAVGSIIAILGLFGILTPEQQAALEAFLKQVTSPAVMLALGTLMTALMSAYRALFKSQTNEGAAAAKQVDMIVAGEKKQATIKTPAGVPDIVVSADKK